MSEVKWVKITTDMFDNRKIKHLRRLPEGNSYALIWIMLLTVAGRCNAGGRVFLTESIPYTTAMLADEFDFEESTVAGALKLFRQLNMTVTESGFLRIAGWEEYQNADRLSELRAKDRERKRAKRAQEKALLSESVLCSSEDVRGQSADVPHTEEEKFIEKKIAQAGFEGKDAEIYREELRENLRLKYMGGALGQDLILMSSEQFDDLCGRLSLDEIEKYFAIVAECERSGKRYKRKSHYQAILDMASNDRRIDC